MASQHPNTSSGSKSRDTRGKAPSQDDVREALQDDAPKAEEALDKGGGAAERRERN